MNLWKALWADENGFVVTAEAALLGTVGVIGATVGVKMAATSVNEEMKEVAYSFRSLDQSYGYNGFRSCNAFTAGSCYVQPPVERSLRELREMEKQERQPKHSHEADRNRRKPNRDGDANRKQRDSKRRDMKRRDDHRDRKPRDRDDQSSEQPLDLKV